MRELIRDWGGEFVAVHHDSEADAWIFIAVHSSRLGRPVGGTRMRVYGSPEEGLRDAQRLAEGMTYKWAAIDFPLGGGKAVIALPAPPAAEAREALLERYGDLVEALSGAFGTGVDMGVGPEDVVVIARRTGYVFGRPPSEGGAGDPGPWTALGVFTGMEVAAGTVFGSSDLEGRTVVVQGVGDVGGPLARRLAEAGAALKLSDVDAGRAERLAGELGAERVPADDVYDEACDILAPCAVGGVLNAETIPRLRCRIVAGSANNQLGEAEDAERLLARGILYAPDYIINAGGAIAHGGLEALDMNEAEVRERVLGIGPTLEAIFDESARDAASPVHAADRRARAVLERGRA